MGSLLQVLHIAYCTFLYYWKYDTFVETYVKRWNSCRWLLRVSCFYVNQPETKNANARQVLSRFWHPGAWPLWWSWIYISVYKLVMIYIYGASLLTIVVATSVELNTYSQNGNLYIWYLSVDVLISCLIVAKA